MAARSGRCVPAVNKIGKHKSGKNEIWIYNNGQYERELVCAGKWMRLIYGSPAPGAPLLFLLKRKIISRVYGAYCRTGWSARGIDKFIRDYQVDMSGCGGEYKNFAEFFAREKNDIRFPEEPGVLGSPCEGLASLSAGIDPGGLVAAKGAQFSLAELFQDEGLAREYEGGTMLRVRLSPANYHRMHFFDSGVVETAKFIDGELYSVSPLALRQVARLYCRNKRALILFRSENFGRAAIVEVGATFVGGIEHCFAPGEPVRRGQQASVFMPGGSLVLVFFRQGAFAPGGAIIGRTAAGFESKIRAGEPII